MSEIGQNSRKIACVLQSRKKRFLTCGILKEFEAHLSVNFNHSCKLSSLSGRKLAKHWSFLFLIFLIQHLPNASSLLCCCDVMKTIKIFSRTWNVLKMLGLLRAIYCKKKNNCVEKNLYFAHRHLYTFSNKL